MSASFLRKGLELVPKEEIIMQVPIGAPDSRGKQFVVLVKNLPIEEIRAFNRQKEEGVRRGYRPGSAAEAAANERKQLEWSKRFIRKVAKDFLDLTGENFDAINKGSTRIGGDPDEVRKFYETSELLEFSPELAEYLSEFTRYEDFGEPIWEACWRVVAAAEEEREEKKVD